MTITTIRIHPAIGIARLGNSPDKFFVGPEVPGVYPNVDRYRDSKLFLKRQGARFRLFGYDKNDRVIGELNADDRRIKNIKWTVHLKNTKAAGPFFAGVLEHIPRRRNPRYPKRSLVLDGQEVSIAGKNKKLDIFCEWFMKKKFPEPLKLGTLRTDAKGRLIILGGRGFSGSLTGVGLGKPEDNFANNSGWYDDTSDGSIRATVTWQKRSSFPRRAKGAWVIVAPPKYAPSLQSVITLYDTLYQVALDKGLLERKRPGPTPVPTPLPSFSRDIYPILRRAYEMRWVFARAEIGHAEEIDLRHLSTTDFEKLCLRARHIFEQFREPSDHPTKPGVGAGKMPYIWSDLYSMGDDSPDPHPVNATLTRHQYDVMQAWSEGHFDRDWPLARHVKKEITPDGLDRAALEPCVGAAFYPGIETSFHIRDRFNYIEPFRLDSRSVKPGDVTQQMSLPWQTDFVDCSDGDLPLVWWPAQRPIDVRPHLTKDPVRWARNFRSNKEDVDSSEMVSNWWRFGLLKHTKGGIIEAHRVNKVLFAPPRIKSRPRRP